MCRLGRSDRPTNKTSRHHWRRQLSIRSRLLSADCPIMVSEINSFSSEICDDDREGNVLDRPAQWTAPGGTIMTVVCYGGFDLPVDNTIRRRMQLSGSPLLYGSAFSMKSFAVNWWHSFSLSLLFLRTGRGRCATKAAPDSFVSPDTDWFRGRTVQTVCEAKEMNFTYMTSC